MLKYLVLDDFDFNGKLVGLRVDINSPIIDDKIINNPRIKSACITISELIKKGAKIVLLAHQGRKGKSDCLSLENHKKFIEKELNLNIKFQNEIYSKKVKSEITTLKNGDVLLLENLRFYDDELKPDKKNNIILKLEKLFDYYVFDAFSVSHRSQTSVVGFKKIPFIAGRTMQKELEGLNSISNTDSPKVFLFGGAKPDDLVKLMDYALKKNKVDKILLSGVIGEIGLYLSGYNIGLKYNFLEQKGYLNSINEIKSLLIKFKNKIVLPLDLAYFNGKKRIEISVDKLNSSNDLNKYLIQDIGKETIKKFGEIINNSGSVYFKGPAGNFEDKNFEFGSKNLIQIMSKSKAFTFMGGGHSITALEKYSNLKNFSYVSLAGGALVKFLCDEKLSGVEMLKQSYYDINLKYDDFVVIGSNVIDTDLQLNLNFNEIHLGDKIKIDEDFKKSVGGGGINVSICLSRLGNKVAYLGKFSKESEDLVKLTLKNNNINFIKTIVSKKPAAKSILIDTKDNDRLIFTYRGQNEFLKKVDFNIDDFKSNNYYLTSLLGESFETIIYLVNEIKKRNKNSKFCYNLSINLINQNKQKLKLLLKKIDIIILNYEEGEALTGNSSISQVLRKLYNLTNKKGLVIITDGAHGSFAFDGNKEYYQKSIEVKKIVDTTGAGDSFAGTFFNFYVNGYGIKESMKLAAENASNVIRYKGAIKGLMNLSEFNK